MARATTKKTKETTAAKTTKPRKTATQRLESAISNDQVELSESSSKKSSNIKTSLQKYTSSKKLLLVVLIIGLLALAFYKKDLFIASIVNGTPVTNFEVIDRMNKQFRQQTLDQITNEKLLLQEARKNQIVISNTDIDQKITDLESKVGGPEALDGLLLQQGQTREGLRDQLKFQIIIEKLYENEATVSAQEVATFIEQNKATMQASDSAGQTKEATDYLKQQKLYEIFDAKFREIKDQASIQTF